MSATQSTIVAIACLYLIMGLAGCTTLTTETVKKAIEKRKHEPCQCDTQPPIIIIIED